MNTTKTNVAALLAALAIPAVVSAAEFYYRCEGDAGTFETPANWYVGNVAQEAYPGEGDAICCTNGLKTIRFAEPGATHRIARVTLDKNGKYDDKTGDSRTRTSSCSWT